ncbi:hypothetical protein MGG_08656 [Pyricularia oryzae 70-15]|uniref:Major facilitator superfamily (MFS) profile domain-containing protein n=3 Tax=Pyricularia oryzae TaxID=318829 RepID=G4MLF5_PYRO7|nr:uncharacterized protein MGG_08656 [Pyricularia oryzae 70-15]EHA58476.1 hypothetical protein MGG_08656 [Pyricularia oryzae 70-15]
MHFELLPLKSCVESQQIVPLHHTVRFVFNMASGTGVASADNSILPDEPATPMAVMKDENTPTANSDARVEAVDPADSYSKFGPKQRLVIIAIASTIGVLSPLSSNLYTPAIPAVAKDLGVSTDAINLTITSYLVLQGISPTLWSVIGDNTGRRLLYLIALTVYLGSCVGLALSPNYPSVLALRAVQAVGSASTTAIGASLIGDLIHVSQRGGWMGNYSAMGGAGTAFGPVLGGLFAQYTGWRGMFVFMAALAAFLLMTTAFLLPETKRDIVHDGSVPAPWYLQAPIKWLDAPKSTGHATGRATAGKFKIDLKAPVRLLVEPECLCVVLFTGVIFAVWQATMVATATLYSERYDLSETNIGLTYISNGVGSLCGSILTGKLLDREYKRQLQREKTQDEGNEEQQPRQQEVQHIELARIKPLIIPTVVFLVSVVALGWIMEYHVHIAASITIAFFVGGLSTIVFAGFSILIVDLFKSQSFSATASMNLSRCLIASGGTAAIGPLIRAVGVGWAFTICAAVGLASCSLALAELWRGRHWRAKRNAAKQV